MCGIAGFTNFNESDYDKSQVITAMCDVLSHRGPDEWGQHHVDAVSFGHTRLSIVGLSDGQQPMTEVQGELSITFNGEIYNYKELKDDLVKDGYEFKTKSDTEIILAMYRKHGTDCFAHFNGMFALAIWDKRKQELVMARDRAGKKPLFYYLDQGDIVFSSELKSLVKHPRFKKKLSAKGLHKFMTFEYIPGPCTIFEDTYKLEAGQFMVLTKDHIYKDFYWNYPSPQLHGSPVTSEEQAIDDIDKLLNDAVRLRLQADVPVGVFLSGGLDSSLVTAVACKQMGKPINSFSIYFNEKSYDESEYIDIVVKKFGLNHHSEYVSADDMLGLVDKLGGIMDEPMADASLVPTYFVSKIAASKMKTVLGGDGADELFAGYPTYLANKLVNIYNIIPYEIREFISSTLQQGSSLLPTSNKNMSADFKVRQFLRGAGVAGEIRFFKWMAGFTDQEKESVLSQEMQAKLVGDFPYEDVSRYLSRVSIMGELDRLLYLSQKMYLTEDILVKVDRASMQNSLEVRAPFLDYRMVEYAAALPDRYKLKRFTGKYILKELARRYLPNEIIDRPKKGFGIPLSEWLSGPLKPVMMDLLSKDRLEQQGLFEYEGVKTLIDQHVNGELNQRKLLWSLLSFQLWAKEFGL
ncbi:MAG: asparagine synthase (glutamine-hydrolyzing) [Candidatus Melainabacteria bacterium]|nr:asparagine synthase (glutamine-hydrolyzing) [Candidatus Melainabacteria bacterium]